MDWPPIKDKLYYHDDYVCIYNADCMDILPLLPKVDLILTDFPYGINEDYDNYNDTQENLVEIILNILPMIVQKSEITFITCGVKNMYLYPKPDWVMAWISSAGIGCGPWGFCCWQPILTYGKCPYLKNGKGSIPDIFLSNETSQKNGHPCPKPINLWKKILLRGSINNTDIILDPFLGSGTTAIAAKQLGRKCIGIERELEYCKIAVDRCRQEVLDLF